MKIFSILVFKNEVDILQYTIDKALVWSDYILIVDNMSNDGSWELINKIYQNNPKILIWGQYGGEFTNTIRQMVFNHYQRLMHYGDWICRLDADEIYIDNPKDFLTALPATCDCIYNKSFQFYFTEKDYEYELANGYQNFDERLKYYLPNHSEIRFVKYCPYSYWLQNMDWPHSRLYPAAMCIRLKHFQYRSINQIKNRLYDRIHNSGKGHFAHEKKEFWNKGIPNYVPSAFEREYRIVPSNLLKYDNGNYETFKNNFPPPPLKTRIAMRARSFIYNLIFKNFDDRGELVR